VDFKILKKYLPLGVPQILSTKITAICENVIPKIDFEGFPWLEKYFLTKGSWRGGSKNSPFLGRITPCWKSV
jgi:hypothetical protein